MKIKQIKSAQPGQKVELSGIIIRVSPPTKSKKGTWQTAVLKDNTDEILLFFLKNFINESFLNKSVKVAGEFSLYFSSDKNTYLPKVNVEKIELLEKEEPKSSSSSDLKDFFSDLKDFLVKLSCCLLLMEKVIDGKVTDKDGVGETLKAMINTVKKIINTTEKAEEKVEEEVEDLTEEELNDKGDI